MLLVLADDVHGNNAKEDALEPAEGVDEVGHVPGSSVPGIKVKHIEHGLEDRPRNGVGEGGERYFSWWEVSEMKFRFSMMNDNWL